MTCRSTAPTNVSYIWATPEVGRRDGSQRELARLKPADSNAAYLPANDALLAATAHELRLPLSHIKGFVSSLLRADVQWDEETRRDFLAEIETEVGRLTDLVERLLESGHPDAAANHPTSVPAERRVTSPAALVEGGLHRARNLLRDRSIRVEVPNWLPLVYVDAEAIERVFANLLQNAAKYSPAFGQIEVSARPVGLEAVEINIDDEGLGVPEDERQVIFDPYVRGSMGLSGVAGHGLGLAISQAIMQAHGGHIRVDDAPAGGARFTVRLPVELASYVSA
jgi:two-component system sensor histidine kinase KdpD